MSIFRRTFGLREVMRFATIVSLVPVGSFLQAQSRSDLSQWPSEALKAEAERNAKLLWEEIVTECDGTYYYAGSGLDNISKTGQPIPYKNGLGGDITKYQGVRMFVVPPGKGTAASRENAARLGIVDGGVAVLASTTFSSGLQQTREFGPAVDGPLSNIPASEMGNPNTFGKWYAREFTSTLTTIGGGAGSGGFIRVQMQRMNGEWQFSLIGLMADDPRDISTVRPEHKLTCRETKPLEELSAIPRGCEIESTLRSTPDALGLVNLEVMNRTAGAVKVYSIDQNGIKVSRGLLKINTSGLIVGPTNTFYVAKDASDRCIEVVQTRTADSLFRVEYSGQRGTNPDQCSGWKAPGFSGSGGRVVASSSGVINGNLASGKPPSYPTGAITPSTKPGQPIVVVLQARIDTDGHVISLSVVSTPSCDFANAAIAAVSQWLYKPSSTMVDTTVNVTFQPPDQHSDARPELSPQAPQTGSRLFQEYFASCNSKDAKACVMVAYCYNHGKEGVSVDPKMAKQYYDKACAMGSNQGCRESKWIKVE